MIFSPDSPGIRVGRLFWTGGHRARDLIRWKKRRNGRIGTGRRCAAPRLAAVEGVRVRCDDDRFHPYRYASSNGIMTTVAVTVDTVLVRDSEPMPTTVDDEVVVLSVRAGAYFGFNRIGSEIWNMLSEPRRVGQILDTLAQSHEVDLDTMTRDVTQFLQTLIERRLVRVVDSKESR